MRLTASRALFLTLAFALFGCGAAEMESAEAAPKTSTVERYFPATEGSVWSYDVDTGEELKSLVISRAVMRQGAHIAISNSGAEPIFYELRADGVFHLASGSYLLKLPFEPGASWRSRDGLARIIESGARVDVDSGSFSPCVIVEESRAGSGAIVRTAYCEDVGVARIETSFAEGAHPRPTVATLRGYQIAE